MKYRFFRTVRKPIAARAIASGLCLLLCVQALALPAFGEEFSDNDAETMSAGEWYSDGDSISGEEVPETEAIPEALDVEEESVEILSEEETLSEEEMLPAGEEPDWSSSYVEYTVPEWATLTAIAGHYGVTEAEILAFNGVETIAPGDVLWIPVDPDSAPAPYVPPERHVVQPGETLAGIAEAYGVPLESLCRWNNFVTNYELGVGQELIIPQIPDVGGAGQTAGYSISCVEKVYAGEALEVPLYFQTDYPDTLYGDGTVATEGCGITCLAMVATAMTGHTYLPDELAEYFGGRADNNVSRLEYGTDKLGLPYWQSPNWNETVAALKQGKLVIVLLNGNSPFTDTQHFIVLTGVDEEGRIWVNDPNAANYEKWDLKEGFANGFTAGQLLQGYSGAWIYDPAQMPQEVPVYTEPRLDTSTSRYPGIQLTYEERELLASVIWVEARGECLEGQQAVAEVVFNRLISPQFSDTLSDVIYGSEQFCSILHVEDAEPGQAQYQAIDRALYGENILPTDVVYFSRKPTNDSVWGEIGHHVFCYG